MTVYMFEATYNVTLETTTDPVSRPVDAVRHGVINIVSACLISHYGNDATLFLMALFNPPFRSWAERKRLSGGLVR